MNPRKNANSEDDEKFKPAGNDDSAFVTCKLKPLIFSVPLKRLSTMKKVKRIE